ncbi:ABC transporter substrate-binding protein [Rudaeicoccus suwonensis]|uniref:Uncharacterized protein n=1 Tax=Rudaeicoccus suwonensis TaxID=657409 RepID=A0A561E6K2_9MICO|nr:ABC transporter substrate-binding protein [Rudaeicoccus suwonensis]TWE11245.1 hypothetical protein BKA23_0007 [Rudaeicoccus suwonensis]
MRRLARSTAAVALALGATGTLGVATAPQALAAGYNGFCTTSTGVTVVVDFQQLGGGVVVRCAPSIPAGGTGLDALQNAGVPYAGVARWGDAFICRLFNKPSATQTLPVTGDPSYKEACVNTPPASAYWSYWFAPNGGTWTYSQFGVTNRSAIKGGFEGWSFSLNATAGSNPPPRIAPVRPQTSSPTPTPTTTSTTAPHNGGGGGGTTQATAPAQNTGSTALPSSLAAHEPASQQAAESKVNPSQSAAIAAAGAAQNAKNQGLIVNSNALNQQVAKEQSTSLNLPTLIGAGVLAFLVVAGIGTLIRRRGH